MSEKKGSLLIVDDEEQIVTLLKHYANEFSEKIFTAYNGKEALEILKKEKIHCVLSDIKMPEMDGIQLIKNVREMGLKIPYIFYTGFGNEELMVEALNYGAYDFLDKPNFTNLQEILKKGLLEGITMLDGKDQKPKDEGDAFITQYQKMLKDRKDLIDK